MLPHGDKADLVGDILLIHNNLIEEIDGFLRGKWRAAAHT
jgi:hypothetical protein